MLLAPLLTDETPVLYGAILIFCCIPGIAFFLGAAFMFASFKITDYFRSRKK